MTMGNSDDEKGEICLTENTYEFEGLRYDLGDKLGFLKATVEFALRRKDLGAPFQEYLADLIPCL